MKIKAQRWADDYNIRNKAWQLLPWKGRSYVDKAFFQDKSIVILDTVYGLSYKIREIFKG